MKFNRFKYGEQTETMKPYHIVFCSSRKNDRVLILLHLTEGKEALEMASHLFVVC